MRESKYRKHLWPTSNVPCESSTIAEFSVNTKLIRHRMQTSYINTFRIYDEFSRQNSRNLAHRERMIESMRCMNRMRERERLRSIKMRWQIVA